MLVSFTCLWAQGVTDVITLQSFYDAGYSGTCATPGNITATESGAEYSATDVMFKSGEFYLYSKNELFTVTKSAGMIGSVELQGTSGTYDVYVSHEAITKSNCTSAELVGTIYNGSGTVTVEGNYEYVALRLVGSDLNRLSSLSFTWRGEEQGGGDDPEPPVVSGGSDAITLQTFKDAGYSGNTGDYFNDATVTGTTGAEYKASEIDYADNGLYFYYIGEVISVTKSVGMIASVEMVGSEGVYDVLVSHEPITKTNYSAAENIGTINGTGTVTVNGDYEYAAIRVTGSQKSPFTSLTFNWRGEEAPALADHITPANLKAQNPEGKFNPTGFYDHENANDVLNYKGESGADYYLSEVISDGTNYWLNDWNYPNPKGECYNTSAPGYIKSIKFDFDYTPNNITFYVSANPITSDNKYQATQVQIYQQGGVIPEYVPDVVCKYFYMDVAQERYSDICVTWTSEAPLIAVKTPEINCWADPVTPGSNVNISTETQNATLHLSVYVNDVLNEELSKDVEGSSTSFEMPGKAGDVVKVEVYATADEMVQSETATATYTLEMPLAATPQLEEGWLSYVIPGQQLTIKSETEGAQITYKMSVSDWNNAENNWEGEEVTAPSPVTVTVPEQAKPGTTFVLVATAMAEGYQQSYQMQQYVNAISSKLDVPTFSLEDGTEVRSGTELRISRPDHATGIRYTINGGEEKTCEDWALYYNVTEDVTITAWAYGEAPFEESEKVTCSYKIEKFELWHNVIVPESFTTSNDDLNNYNKNLYQYTDENTNVNYVYDGGLYPSNGSNCFYMATEGSILYNTTPGELKRIKVDGANNWSSVYIVFSDEAPVTEITTEMADYDYAGPRLRVGASGETVAAYGEWIDLKALGTVGGLDLSKAKYFAIYRFGQNNYVSRVVVEYDPKQAGVNPDPAATPALQGEAPEFVVAGQELTLVSATEGAQITYQLAATDAENAENNWQGEAVTAASPVTVTVPAEAKPGTTFTVTATAAAEGFETSEAFTFSAPVVDAQLQTPAFNLADGAEVVSGTTLKITLPANAKGIRYTVNDGEEQTSGETVVMKVTEAMTVTAWAYGEVPFVESDKVTRTYTVEPALALWQNAVVPECFTEDEEDLKGPEAGFFIYTFEASKDNNVNYIYSGSFRPTDDENNFCMTAGKSVLYTANPAYINRIKIEGSTSAVYVLLSDEVVDAVTDDMMAENCTTGIRFRIGEDGIVNYGQWFDYTAINPSIAGKKFLSIYSCSGEALVSRIVVDYDSVLTGIEGVEKEDGHVKIYSVNGVLMNSDKNLAPGVYVRTVNGKSVKFVVK